MQQIVTLLTDYGTDDYYVTLLKASLYTHVSNIEIVDISHLIKKQDIMEAAFFLSGVYGRFPVGTIHCALVHTFYHKHSNLIVFDHQGHKFIGPNNGLFSLIFDHIPDPIYALDEPITVSNQYELAAHAVAHIADTNAIEDIGPKLDHFEKKISLQPVITSDQIRATIIHIDHFGNVMVNVDHDTFNKVRKGRKFEIFYKATDPITTLSNSYCDKMIGDVCAFFNTIGILEIAVNMGNAHELLNLNKNETIQINFL